MINNGERREIDKVFKIPTAAAINLRWPFVLLLSGLWFMIFLVIKWGRLDFRRACYQFDKICAKYFVISVTMWNIILPFSFLCNIPEWTFSCKSTRYYLIFFMWSLPSAPRTHTLQHSFHLDLRLPLESIPLGHSLSVVSVCVHLFLWVFSFPHPPLARQ
jgi:hypothetical protein